MHYSLLSSTQKHKQNGIKEGDSPSTECKSNRCH